MRLVLLAFALMTLISCSKSGEIEKEVIQHSENISSIFMNMSEMFYDEYFDDSVTDQDLIVAGIFPSTLEINKTAWTIKTPDSGSVAIKGAAGREGYFLLYSKIKQSACVGILKSQRYVGWDSFGVKEGTTISSSDVATQFSKSEVSDFSGACETDNDWVSLGFKGE